MGASYNPVTRKEGPNPCRDDTKCRRPGRYRIMVDLDQTLLDEIDLLAEELEVSRQALLRRWIEEAWTRELRALRRSGIHH